MAVAKKQTTREPKAEETKTEEVKVTRPEDLAKELGVSGKQIRAWLRKVFTDHPKRTSWLLTPKQAQAVREHFAPVEDNEEEVVEV